MPNLTNVLVNAAGAPLVGARVTVELVGVWSVDGDREAGPKSVWSGVTDSAGVWVASLPAQVEWEGDTYYTVHEPNKSHTCTVAVAPDTQRLRDRLMVPVSPAVAAGLAFDDLIDVATSGASPGDVPVFQADGSWVPGSFGGGAAPYRHDQLAPATVWNIPHNFGYYPAVVSLHSADLSQSYEMFTVQHLDTNNLRVAMEISTAGVALVI